MSRPQDPRAAPVDQGGLRQLCGDLVKLLAHRVVTLATPLLRERDDGDRPERADHDRGVAWTQTAALGSLHQPLRGSVSWRMCPHGLRDSALRRGSLLPMCPCARPPTHTAAAVQLVIENDVVATIPATLTYWGHRAPGLQYGL
jgi:hypothetical protein